MAMIKEWVERQFGGLERRELVGLALVAALIVGGAGFWYVRSLPSRIHIATTYGTPGSSRSAPALASAKPSPSPAGIVVDVAGWVHQPGVYRFYQGDRIVDAIERAGGGKPGADLTSLNLAALLTDGEQIIVNRLGHTGPTPPGGSTIIGGSSTSSSGAGSTGDLINLNTATLDEIESLPGIGPVLGQKIIDYRTSHGPFKSIEDLMNVSGIGDKRFADLKPHITV